MSCSHCVLLSGKYRLKAFVSHMGASASCGHYVCHIRKVRCNTTYHNTVSTYHFINHYPKSNQKSSSRALTLKKNPSINSNTNPHLNLVKRSSSQLHLLFSRMTNGCFSMTRRSPSPSTRPLIWAIFMYLKALIEPELMCSHMLEHGTHPIFVAFQTTMCRFLN